MACKTTPIDNAKHCFQCGEKINLFQDDVHSEPHFTITAEDLEIESAWPRSVEKCRGCGLTDLKKLKDVTTYGTCLPLVAYVCKPCERAEKIKAREFSKRLKSHCHRCNVEFKKPRRKNRFKWHNSSGLFYCEKCFDEFKIK